MESPELLVFAQECFRNLLLLCFRLIIIIRTLGKIRGQVRRQQKMLESMKQTQQLSRKVIIFSKIYIFNFCVFDRFHSFGENSRRSRRFFSLWREYQQQINNPPMNIQIGARRLLYSGRETKAYEFVLKGKGKVFIKNTIKVDFTPVKALNTDSEIPELTSYSITPTFNFDQKFYSPAFTNSYDGIGSDMDLRKEYHSKVKEQSTEIISHRILLPKPRRSEVCFVCRQYFEDYLEHIESSIHNKAVKSSIFNNYINELIKKKPWIKKKKVSKPKRLMKKGRPIKRQRAH